MSQTHFGYKQVPEEEKKGLVADVFHSVAGKYDLMNDLMSFGAHRLWKRFTVGLSHVREGDWVLDVAGGTGDLSARFAKEVGPRGRVFLTDINQSMLETGRDRLLDQGLSQNIIAMQADAESLPFADNLFQCVSIGFGLRNVTNKLTALQSMYRVLKPGGRLLVLEFSKPTNELLKSAYDAYSFKLLPKIGEWVTGDKDSYQYLVESIRMHPGQEELQKMFEAAGFDCCDYHNLFGGIVAVHVGTKA